MYKILKYKADCVLLRKDYDEDVKYVVKDIEGDTVYMCLNNLCKAEKAFDSYDINKVREEKKKEFEKWLNENTERKR